LKPEFIDNIRKSTIEGLESYSKIVKPGKLGMQLVLYYHLKIKNKYSALTTDIGQQFNFIKDQKILASKWF
jgi:16S rRNA (cytosine967-C5)-methyltransferase